MSGRSTIPMIVSMAMVSAHAFGAAEQGVVMQRNLSLGLAKTIAEAAQAECQAKGFHTSVAVVDRAAQVLVILRDEQATAQTADIGAAQGLHRPHVPHSDNGVSEADGRESRFGGATRSR